MKQFNGLRHGEVALIPAKERLEGKKLQRGDYILAHSETGHHHVLEGFNFDVIEAVDNRLQVEVFGDTALVHRKQYDKHRTITIPPTLLERYEMVEYNPAEQAIQKVKD